MMNEPRLPTGSDLGFGSRGTPLRVLVVESAAHAARLLREADSSGGIGVEAARDPAEALQRLQERGFDAVVIDLPGQQQVAEELFHRIADIDPRLAGRVVFLAGDLSDPATRRFLTAAGRPFLTHPVDPTQLYDLVIRVGLEESPEDG
jgi:CheY-like chemotaxis protein